MPKNYNYVIGPYLLDVDRLMLTRAGALVPLGPKALELLTVLVAQAGKVVGKDELVRTVWPNIVVEEGNLTQNIFQLRCALGDVTKHPRYIRTFPKRGYCFVGEVKTVCGDTGDTVKATDGEVVVHLAASIETVMNEIGLALMARGKSPAEVEQYLTAEARRVAQELEDEETHFTH